MITSDDIKAFTKKLHEMYPDAVTIHVQHQPYASVMVGTVKLPTPLPYGQIITVEESPGARA